MKKIVYILFTAILLAQINYNVAEASFISDRSYRIEQKKENKQNLRLIKDLFKVHDKLSNSHDLKMLDFLYADNYINSDGFDKKTYFKSIEKTWESCKDISYTTKILSITINGDNADVSVEETASGTIVDNVVDFIPIAGEIHSSSKSIYHLTKINGKWYISSETLLSDESSLLYGDARFINIEIQAPGQVSAGQTYTVILKADTDNDTFAVGSIDHDPVTYPANTPKSELRAINSSKTLERYIKANSDNINEYAVGSIAFSKVKKLSPENVRLYMAGLACVMKRVNVIPKNNFIEIEE